MIKSFIPLAALGQYGQFVAVAISNNTKFLSTPPGIVICVKAGADAPCEVT